MKALKALIPALAACGLLAAADASAQVNGAARASGGANAGAMTRHWSGSHGTWSGGGGRHWSGSRHWGGHSHWRGSWGLYLGVPLVWSSWYWGWPHYYDPYYYPRTIIYREVEPYPQSFPEGEMAPSTTEVQRAPGSPSQGPLYMNYCESAQAYYPKVTSCPEGWKFISPSN